MDASREPVTAIENGMVVAFDGREHRLLPNGTVAFAGDTITHVGPQHDGPIDRRIDATGMLVIPGQISAHAHVSAQEGGRLLIDAGRRDFLRAGFLNYLPMKQCFGRSFLERQDLIASTKFGMATLLRHGVTTVVAFAPGGSDNGKTMTELAGEIGIRLYYAPTTTGGSYWFDEKGKLHRTWDEEGGLSGLERAAEYIETFDGSFNDRIKGILVIDEFYNVTPAMLRRAKDLAKQLSIGITLHFSEQLWEFTDTVRSTGNTPVGVLDAEGFLGPEVILAHCMYVAGHSFTCYPYVDDLGVIARSGASVAHSPLAYSRRGIALESFDRYLGRGINMCLGTDSYPLDLLGEMRMASTMCKLVERNHEAGRAVDVFNASNLGGAKALNRQDLGRIAPGAKADIVLVDMNNLTVGPHPDPIRALVHLATPQSVDTVIVDGRTVVADKRVLVCDEGELLAQTRASSEAVWTSFPEYHWAGRTVEEEFPASLKRWDA